MDVHEEPHQLGHRHRGVRVVELDGVLLVEGGEVLLSLLVDADHVLERAGHEEVLLLEPQPLAPHHLVVGVEDLGDVLRVHLLVHRAPVVPLVEGVEVEGLGGLRLPEAQEVRRAVAVAEDRHVVGDAAHDALRHPAHAVAAALVLEALRAAAQAHVVGDLRARGLPGVAEGQPLVGLLDLPPVADQLVEDPELVADPVAERRDPERRERVHVAGREPPEPAVAEAGLLLLGEDVVEVVAELGHGLPRLLLQAEVQEVVAQVGPQEELGREVADGAAGPLEVRLARRHPPAHDVAAHRQRQRQVAVVGRRRLREAPQRGEEGLPELLLHGLDDRPIGHASLRGGPVPAEHSAACRAPRLAPAVWRRPALVCRVRAVGIALISWLDSLSEPLCAPWLSAPFSPPLAPPGWRPRPRRPLRPRARPPRCRSCPLLSTAAGRGRYRPPSAPSPSTSPSSTPGTGTRRRSMRPCRLR